MPRRIPITVSWTWCVACCPKVAICIRSTTGVQSLQSSVCHRSWRPLERGNRNLLTAAGPSKGPNHPSPTQKATFTNALIHWWPAQITHAAMSVTRPRPSQTETTVSPAMCWPRTPSPHQPPAASRPASTEQWLEVGLVSLHIRRCRYINGYKWHMPTGNCPFKQQTKPSTRKKGT